jgi:hypothetical protein
MVAVLDYEEFDRSARLGGADEDVSIASLLRAA